MSKTSILQHVAHHDADRYTMGATVWSKESIPWPCTLQRNTPSTKLLLTDNSLSATGIKYSWWESEEAGAWLVNRQHLRMERDIHAYKFRFGHSSILWCRSSVWEPRYLWALKKYKRKKKTKIRSVIAHTHSAGTYTHATCKCVT